MNKVYWILFFFIYAFFGWIWESIYVSVRKGIENKRFEFINRGFLKGPVIPIYGFAAIVILCSTLSVKESALWVYIYGALAATVMELVTGTAMEKIFHVKYWNYNYLPLNYHGHICLFVSMVWGVLSLVLVKVIHGPIEEMVLGLPETMVEIITYVAVGVFVYDFSESLKDAMDMRELLEKLTESNAAIKRLEKRINAVIAFTPISSLNGMKEISGNTKDAILERIESFRNDKVQKLLMLKEKLSDKNNEQIRDKDELLLTVESQIRSAFARTNQQYLRVARHLKRNPGAISKKYKEAFENIKSLLEK